MVRATGGGRELTGNVLRRICVANQNGGVGDLTVHAVPAPGSPLDSEDEE